MLDLALSSVGVGKGGGRVWRGEVVVEVKVEVKVEVEVVFSL